MNFVQQYYNFKHKWYFKIGSLLFDFYISKVPNNKVEKIKYEFLDQVIQAYINKEEFNEEKIALKLANVNASALNKLENELLKYVIYVSGNYRKVKFNSYDYIYFAMILEIMILLYSSVFIGTNKNLVYNILKENLFRFEFVDFKRKQTKLNLLLRYLKYINKNEKYYFANLTNKNIEINITSLSYQHNYFIIDFNNKFPDFSKYDEELVESVQKNNDYYNKLFILNFELLVQQIVFMLERKNFSVDKVIFNLDNYKYTRNALQYINKYIGVINKYIMFCSNDRKKLNLISNKYSKCLYITEEKIKNVDEYKDINILVKKSFWDNNKMNSRRYKDLNFITISDNIAYKFEKEEM